MVLDLDDELAAGAEVDFLVLHFAFDLAGLADGGVLDGGEVGFVFVAQGEVQHGIPRGLDVELGELFGGGVGELELLSEAGGHGRGG